MGELEGKVAIVTGASRGIGAAIAQRFAAEGAAVAVTARTAEPGVSHLDGSLRQTVDTIEAAGGRAIAITADLADLAFDAADLVATAEAALGPVDILVNNAAACFYLPWDTVSARRYDVMFRVNVDAPWRLSTAVLAGMRDRGRGWIVNISSMVTEMPVGPPFTPFHAEHGATLYGASKAALERMSAGLAAEVYRHGIAVNVVSPVAAVATPGVLALGLMPGDNTHVEPVEQMAEAALALAVADATTITGRVGTSEEFLRDLDRPVRNLDGSPRAP
jgi:NAD(P)-dependent dehydrogenase (short-subunit alcohol dehydrogenase family)